jgi:hypothetical protein
LFWFSYKSIKSTAIRILGKRIGAQDDADIYFLCESNVSLKRKVFWLVAIATYSCATAHDLHMVPLVITGVILFSNKFTESKGKDSSRRSTTELPI